MHYLDALAATPPTPDLNLDIYRIDSSPLALARHDAAQVRAVVADLMDDVLPALRRAETDPARTEDWLAAEGHAALAWAQLQLLMVTLDGLAR